jgi:hypothetical protein
MMPRPVVFFGSQSIAQFVFRRFSAAIDFVAGEGSRKPRKDADRTNASNFLNMIHSPGKFNRDTLIID